MRNIRISRPNVVMRRAAAESMNVVTCYRGVFPSNNNNNNNNNRNNNHATLVDVFQPSTLHKPRQLGFYN